jgi:hypothetical protein
MSLVVGQKYTKEEFGIKDTMRSEHIVGGEVYTFFTIKNRYSETNRVSEQVYSLKMKHRE